MISVVTSVRIQDGKGAAFERLFLRMAAKVKANEPGVLVYQLTRSRTEPNGYKMIEFYRDQAAFEAHAAADYFQASMGDLASLIAAEPQVEFLDPVE
ncbi:putative quinol monooxygenase [Phenylobacterium sp. LjRoot219]|uniref:putative quinol monooxygenase n=1 Tax=Phenylobacterium sp. LjRoot219 TaxID=3342283 RepID=UPI003ECF3B82